MDPEKKIAQARVALMFRYPFFGYLAVTLELVKDEHLNPPTMATDGKKLYYDPGFVEQITLEELKGVIVHEIDHIILRHPAREAGRKHRRWNMATDYAVNDLVKKERDPKDGSWLELPPGCLYDPAFADKTAEWIYERLPEEGGNTLDSHEHWDKWGKKEKEGEGGEGKDQGDGKGQGVEYEPDDKFEQELREKFAQAAHQAKARGLLPGHLSELLEEALEPKLDWKTILRDMVTSVAKCDYRLVPPNKKYMWADMYLPSLTGEEIKVGFAIDSSGSISKEMALMEIAEVKGICDAYEKYTIFGWVCDTDISQRFELHEFDPLPEIRLTRGGTSFVEPIKEAEAHDISCLIYATDLDGEFPPEPSFPIIWLKVGTYDITPPFGTVIEIPSDISE